MGSTEEELHPMFQDMLRRTDGWRPGENVSSLDFDFMTRHPAMSVLFIAVTTVAAIVGSIGNFLVIGAILSYRPLLRNKGNMFVINLAVADICITTIVSPMNMVGVARGPRFFLDKVVLCHLLGSICTVSCLVSMLSIAAVAVNRLIQICKPFVYHRIYTHKKTLIYCFALWGWAIILDIPNWVGWGGHTFGLKEMGCTFDRVANYGFTMFLATMSIFIPMTIVFGCYIAIIVFVRRSRNEIRKFGKESAIRRSSTPKGGTARKMFFKKDDLQFAFILFVSFLAFVLCWSLYMVALIFDFKDRWPKEIYVAGTILGHTNSCLNSIIYALGYARFRKGYIIFIRKLFCLKTQRNSAALNDSKYSLRYTSKVTGPLSTPITGRSRVLQLDDNPISPPVTTPLTTMCRHGNGWMR